MSPFVMQDSTPGTIPVARNKRDSDGRYRGVNTIRALAALTVVFGHIGFFSSAHDHVAHVPSIVVTLAAILWNGPAAVSIFFIISGFCIHLPYRGQRPIELAPYLSRRLLRVGLPAAVALTYDWFALHTFSIATIILWSVFCEVVYYVIYPLLRFFSRKVKWPTLILTTYLLGLIALLTHTALLSATSNSYTALGFKGTWFIGLPSWMMGCWLAESVEQFPVLRRTSIWSLRLAFFALSVVLRAVKFHVNSPYASNAITLNLFAFAACFWLGCEIRYFEGTQPFGALEWAGEWSYSLYLVHPLVLDSIQTLQISLLLPLIHGSHFWLITIILVLSFGFHLLVEKPSHQFAVWASRRLRTL